MVLTAPLWLLGAHGELLAPGLPLAALGVVCPALAALSTARLTGGRAGVASWWARARPVCEPRAAPLLLLAAGLPVGVAVLSLIWQGRAGAAPVHGLSAAGLLAFAAMALAGAWLEEAGWSAWTVEVLLPAGSAIAALLTGTLWALWHLISLVEVGRSAGWIAWWTVGTLSMRMILVWLYRRGGHRVCAPALFHATDNLCWQAGMSLGATFNPQVHGLLMAALAALLMSSGLHARTRV
jgi:hypothetical protein